MKPFNFTLQRLLDFKERLLEKEKLTLASLRMEQRKLQDLIDYLFEQTAVLQAKMRRKAGSGAYAFELHSLQYQVDICLNNLKSAREEKKKVDLQVERQLQTVMTIDRERAQLEKLKEKQLEEYRLAETREASETISEYVSMKLTREGIRAGA
jgi:flagellar FliJ protein